jgi:hypothetical protein
VTPVRVSETQTTASIADNTSGDLLFANLSSIGTFISVQTSQPAWVRFYTTSTQRTADASRSISSDPTPGSGVLLEVATVSTGQTVLISPATSYVNGDSPMAASIYAAVTNKSGSTNTINVTVTAAKL